MRLPMRGLHAAYSHLGLTRAWATSPLPTSTSAAAKRSCVNGRRSNAKPSWIAACAITHSLPNLSTQSGQSFRSCAPQVVSNHLTIDSCAQTGRGPSRTATDGLPPLLLLIKGLSCGLLA